MTAERPLDEPISSDLVDAGDLVSRLDAVTRRLEHQAAIDAPRGLTDPDPETSERWEAGQVWAHIAEFVPYWHEELERVVGQYDGEPVPFGRVKTDPARIAAIEAGRNEPVETRIAGIRESIAALRRLLEGLGTAEWSAEGVHQTRGTLDAERIVERFLVAHLEEHADQLERLREVG